MVIKHKRGNKNSAPPAQVSELLFALDEKEVITNFGSGNETIFSPGMEIPVGGLFLRYSLPGIPVPDSKYFRIPNGQSVSEPGSLFDGKKIPNITGSTIAITIINNLYPSMSWMASVDPADITALNVGDDISGPGIPPDAYLLAVNYNVNLITIGDRNTGTNHAGPFDLLESAAASVTGKFKPFDGMGITPYFRIK